MPIRGNIAYDQADKVKWSPDSKGNYSKSEMALIDLIELAIELKINQIIIFIAFVVHKKVGDEIEVYKLNKKAEEGGGYSGNC